MNLESYKHYLASMNQKGLTLRDQNFIYSSCRSIAKCENHGVRDKELRQQIYMLGLYTFRQYHKAGKPSDYRYPGLRQTVLAS